jgi:hypothetical protein
MPQICALNAINRLAKGHNAFEKSGATIEGNFSQSEGRPKRLADGPLTSPLSRTAGASGQVVTSADANKSELPN